MNWAEVRGWGFGGAPGLVGFAGKWGRSVGHELVGTGIEMGSK